eukprot:gene36053-42798_t
MQGVRRHLRGAFGCAADDCLLTGAALGIMGISSPFMFSREASVAKPELGTKRLCPNCSTKYYDLNKDPILCPKCGTPFTIAALALRAKAAPVAEEEEEEVEALPDDFVSLEEAD